MDNAKKRAAPQKAAPRKHWKRLRRFLKNPSAVLGSLLVFLALFCALFANRISPYDPGKLNLAAKLAPPSLFSPSSSSHYLLGADQLGRDLLSRIIYGTRVSLTVGLLGVLLACFIGVVLGLFAGFYGGWLDNFIMRIADIQLAFPFILFAIIIMSVLGSGIGKIIIILGLTYWVSFARIIRGETMSIREIEYIEAARAVGSSNLKIIRKHILPNVSSSILVLSNLYIAEFILLEASLTFLGLGADPTIPSWGGMLADSRNYITSAWCTATFPGIAIMLTVLGFNLLGDWLRDEFDPNLKV